MEASTHAATNGHVAPHKAVSSSPQAGLSATEKLAQLTEHEPLLLAARKAVESEHALWMCTLLE
jgi:hypothetical protein